ncbi:MAG TPA: hypothetical protein VIR33_03605 [Thermopolyspora sp.]
MNALELSPLTTDACVRRITSDMHPGRSEAAMCQLAVALGRVAAGRLDQADAELYLRGLAAQADPDGYAELVRITLRADVSQMTEALAGLSQAAERMTPHEAEQRAAEWAATGEVGRP